MIDRLLCRGEITSCDATEHFYIEDSTADNEEEVARDIKLLRLPTLKMLLYVHFYHEPSSSGSCFVS